MIRYQLQCDKDHIFEAWFSNSDAYDKQARCNLITCPQCGSSKVSKAIMAPNIGVKTNRKKTALTVRGDAQSEVAAPQQNSSDESHSPELVNARHEIMAAARKIREIVKKNAEYVGHKFAEEARKIHYEEVEEKGIYGEASAEEVQELLEEGVDIQPLPILPEEKN